MKRRNPIAVRFGQTFRAYRVNSGFSLRTFEKASGISRGLLWKLENGTGNPSLLTLHKLSQSLRVGVDELLA